MRTFKFNPQPEPLELIQGGIAGGKGAGIPRKTTDADAQEKVDDVEKLL